MVEYMHIADIFALWVIRNGKGLTQRQLNIRISERITNYIKNSRLAQVTHNKVYRDIAHNSRSKRQAHERSST